MELLFTGGRVLTMDGLDRIASGVAVRDGKIIAVGDSDEVRHAVGPDATNVDLRGRALIPGFCDPHNHFSMTTFEPRIGRLPYPAPGRQAGRPRRHRHSRRGHARRPVGLGTRIQRPARQRRLAHARRARRRRPRQPGLRDGLLLPRQLRQFCGDVDRRDQLRDARSTRRPDPPRRERRSDRHALRASLGPRPSRLDAIAHRHPRTLRLSPIWSSRTRSATSRTV